MDFLTIEQTHTKNGGYKISPDFVVDKVTDLMTRGHALYAVWDPQAGLWSKSEFTVRSMIDAELYKARDELQSETDQKVSVSLVARYNSGSWKVFGNYLKSMPDNYHELDRRILFSNSEVTKNDYASFVLPYPLISAPCPNYDRLMDTLYDPPQRQKLEWAIGAIIAGDSRRIQKFIVLYGDAGSGKSTFLNIVEKLFSGYCAVFDAKALGTSKQFAMETLKDNPLVAIQQDGDLSHIADNTRLNSIISHEIMPMEEKYKSQYSIKLDTFLFMGTNQLVKITDSKSGIIRRLIDVMPSGRLIPYDQYRRIVEQIDFELSGIAWHCLQVYKELGFHAYDGYKPLSMMMETDHFFSFMEEYYFEFRDAEYVTLSRIWDLYKQYCEDAGIKLEYKYSRQKVMSEAKTYFNSYHDTKRVGPDGKQKRKVFVGFKASKFASSSVEGKRSTDDDISDDDSECSRETEMEMVEVEDLEKLELTTDISELDMALSDYPAQYANDQETPLRKWDDVTTTLKELDTKRLHYVRPPENHIVIDFDLKDENGEKSAVLNIEAANKWPATYAEFSKGGSGIHLHYIYDGDPTKLSALYSPGIEVKVFTGKSSLRRKLSKCNDLPIAHISSGLPLKEEKKVVNFSRISSEKGLRNMIERNLRKEIYPATKPSIDFIYKDLERAYNDGMVYDVRDMRSRILSFANNSSHQSDYCIRLVSKMKFCSEDIIESEKEKEIKVNEEAPIVFYDVECFPNLFLICWKYAGEEHDVVRMYNPKPAEVEDLFNFRLIGFNSVSYDSNMLYGRYLGYTNEQMYKLSQRLIGTSKKDAWKVRFAQAANIDYVDVYDFATTKQSLKKWEIELHIHHQENNYPWDEPLDESRWDEVGDYCANDVRATEVLFNHLQGEFTVRKILADIAEMPVNTSTNKLVEKILFQGNKHPTLVYTDLHTGEQWTGERKMTIRTDNSVADAS